MGKISNPFSIRYGQVTISLLNLMSLSDVAPPPLPAYVLQCTFAVHLEIMQPIFSCYSGYIGTTIYQYLNKDHELDRVMGWLFCWHGSAQEGKK